MRRGMVDQAWKYSENLPKLVIVGTGTLSLLSAAWGLYYSIEALLRVSSGGIAELVHPYKSPYFYPAFYSMLSVAILCDLLLAWCGLDQIRLKVARLKMFIWLFAFEGFFIAFIGGFLWQLPDVAISIAAASGIAIQGLMPPLYFLLPFWGPFAVAWAKRRLSAQSARQPIMPKQIETEKQHVLALRNAVRGKLLAALFGSCGGAGSFFLLLLATRHFDPLKDRVSDFTINMIAFFLAGLLVIYLAKLDSPISLSTTRWRYMAVPFLLSACYIAASLRIHRPSTFFSLLPIALVVGIILNGFSMRAIRNCLWAFAGAILGIIGFVIIERLFLRAGVSSSFGFWALRGVEWYGLTLGLLLSQDWPPPQSATVPGSPGPGSP